MREKEISEEAVRIWRESNYLLSYSEAIEMAIELYEEVDRND